MSPTERCGSARYCWPTSTNGRSGIRPAWIVPLGRGDLGDSVPPTCTVPARARVRIRPRHAALDREVDLERARAVPEPPVGAGDPRRQPVAEDVGDRARARGRTW